VGNPTPLRGALTTPRIVFLVVAAAAPLAAMVGTVPLAFALGNGAGVPAMFVAAGVILLLFSVGYAAMSHHVVNAGGFYTYLARGLGRPVAIAGGMVAIVSYCAVAIGLLGAFGYFADLTASVLGLHLAWPYWSFGALALVAALGYRQVDLSAKVLSLLMVGEFGVLLVLDVAMLVRNGGDALPAASFSPHVIFSGGGLGVSLMFAFISFIGFESAALYGEESRNPRRSIPVATFVSVSLIAAFYALTSWAAVGSIGADHVAETAGEQLGDLFPNLSDSNVGSPLTGVMVILVCTSIFAAVLALHNAANRYLFALGREQVLPRWLGRPHPRLSSPHRASLAQTAVAALVVGVFAIAGLDPYLNLATSALGVGTLGIIALQAAAALAVVWFFRGHPERHWWRTMLAPGLGFIGLTAAAFLVVRNFAVMTGTDNPVVTALPWLLVAAAVAGFAYAIWMRSARPYRYAGIADAGADGVEAAVEPDRDAPVGPRS